MTDFNDWERMDKVANRIQWLTIVVGLGLTGIILAIGLGD